MWRSALFESIASETADVTLPSPGGQKWPRPDPTQVCMIRYALAKMVSTGFTPPSGTDANAG
jgi:hypothetical protein